MLSLWLVRQAAATAVSMEPGSTLRPSVAKTGTLGSQMPIIAPQQIEAVTAPWAAAEEADLPRQTLTRSHFTPEGAAGTDATPWAQMALGLQMPVEGTAALSAGRTAAGRT